MRVLFMTRKFPPSIGGMEIYSQCLYEALRNTGTDIVLYKPGRPIIGRPSLPVIFRFFLGACWTLFRRARSYDIILLGDFAIAGLALIAKACTRGKVRVVVALHGNDLYFRRKTGIKAAVYKWMCSLVVRSHAIDVAIANSRTIQAEAAELGLEKVSVISLATTLPPTLDFFLPRKPPIILYAGRLIRYKGLSWFVETVWPRLGSQFELHVAGPVWDMGEFDCLRNKPGIVYLGNVKHDDLPALRHEALACIMPNLPPTGTEQNEGFGLAALESAAVGTPVVAARTGGLAEVVIDGVTGFLVEPLDANAFAARIDAIAGWNEARRLQFANAARQVIAERFTWERVANDYLAEFERLTGTEVPAA